MRKLLLAIIVIAISAGCATFTTEEGYSMMALPEEEPLKETKLSMLGDTGDITITTTDEEETKTEESAPQQEQESLPPVKHDDGKENLYPAALSLIKYPHIYTPADTYAVKEDAVASASMVVIPLGYEKSKEDDFIRMMDAISDLSPDFIAITGSLENQVMGAKASGWDAVTLRGGTLLFRPEIIGADENKAAFQITKDRSLEITILSMEDKMPSSSADAEAWLDGIDSASGDAVKDSLGPVEGTGASAVYILSSSEPSSADWLELSPYRYRYERNFGISDSLREAGWKDAYSATHFSAETDGGITRHRGDMYERLDFIYTKGLLPEETVSFTVEGLTDITGSSALFADIIIP